jgi:hypothetical protein
MLKEFENIKQREAKRQKAKDEKINERFRWKKKYLSRE